MSQQVNFTVIGQFEDHIGEGLRGIQRLLRTQVSIQRRINASTRQLQRIQQNLAEAQEGSAEATEGQADAAGRIRENALAAKMKANALKKISQGINKGVSDSIKNLQKVVGSITSVLKRSFSEAMTDQLDDIQATAATYGSLLSADLIKAGPGSYGKAKKMYKKLDSSIADVVRTSTAPTATITYFSRSLTDNLLPTLLKQAKEKGLSMDEAIGPAAKKLAKFYEKAALLTPAGYSTGMVGKALQMAIQGESEGRITKYDFFQMNPTVLNSMRDQGLWDVGRTFEEKFEIIQKALEKGLPDAAIDEMSTSISGGMQALQDTFWNPSVGILSFARTFGEETDKHFLKGVLYDMERQKGGHLDPAARIGRDVDIEEMMKDVSSPLEIIGLTLGPFLQDIANLFGEMPPVMGRVALFWNQHFGPGLRSLSTTLKILQDNINQGIMTIPEALGRFTAEGLKIITSIFESGMSLDANPVLKSFMEGFDSLGKAYNFKEMATNFFNSAKKVMTSIIGKIFMAIIAWSMAWALGGAIVQVAAQTITWGLIEVGKLLIPKVLMFLFNKVFLTIVAYVTGPLVPIIAIGVAVAAVLALVIRYRNEIKLSMMGFENVVMGYGKIVAGIWPLLLGIVTKPLAWLVDTIIGGLQKLPLLGKYINDANAQEKSDEAFDLGMKMITEGSSQIGEGFMQITEANVTVGLDLKNQIGNVINFGKNMYTKVTGGVIDTAEKGEDFTESSAEAAEYGVELVGAANAAVITQTKASLAISQQAEVLRSSYPAIAEAINGLSRAAAAVQLSGTGGVNYGAIGELSGSLMERAKSMFETLRGMGFSKYGAAALVGSMMQESGINPGAVEPNGQGHGLLQWSFGRRDKLKQRYGNDWNKLNNQLEYMMSEKGSEGALSRLMNSQSREAAFAAEKSYIRYLIPGKRYSYADKIMQQEWFKYKGHVPNEFANISKLTNNVTQTFVNMKQANTQTQTKSDSLEYDLLDPSHSGSKQLYSLGRKVAAGVVSVLDEAIATTPLCQY